jgi:hypothetical protein
VSTLEELGHRFRKTRAPTHGVLKRMLEELRELVGGDKALIQRLRQVLEEDRTRRSFRSWLEWCLRGATEEEPISKELNRVLVARYGQPEQGGSFGRLTLLRACLEALEEVDWSVPFDARQEDAPGNYEAGLLLAAGLNLSFVNHNSGRQESNYHVLLADLLPPRLIDTVMVGFMLPDATGTNEWAVEAATDAASRNESFFDQPKPTVLYSSLSDVCGIAEMEDLLTGKMSVFLQPIFGRRGQHPIGTLYVAFPMPGLFFDEELHEDLPFVYQLWSRIVDRYRHELAVSASYEDALRVLDVTHVDVQRTTGSTGLGELNLIPKLFPERLGLYDAPGFLIGAHAKIDSTGFLDVNIGIQEKGFFDHMFTLLRESSVFPDGWSPHYVRDMELKARAGPHELVHAAQVGSGAAGDDPSFLKDTLDIYSNRTNVHDLTLGLGCVVAEGEPATTLGAVRINYHTDAPLDANALALAQTAFREPGECIARTLQAFQDAIDEPSAHLSARRVMVDARKAFFELVCNHILRGFENEEPRSQYDRRGILRESLLLIGPETMQVGHAHEIQACIDASLNSLERFAQALEGTPVGIELSGYTVLVSGWFRGVRFALHEEPAGLSFEEARVSSNLLRFLRNTLDLMARVKIRRAHFSFRHHAHERVGPELIVVPAIRGYASATMELAHDFGTASVQLQLTELGAEPIHSSWSLQTAFEPVTYALGATTPREVLLPSDDKLDSLVNTDHGAWKGETTEATLVSLDELFSSLCEEHRLTQWFLEMIRFVEHREVSTDEPIWRVISAGRTAEDGIVFSFGHFDMRESDLAESESLIEIRERAMKGLRDRYIERTYGWNEGVKRARRKHTHVFSGKLEMIEWAFDTLRKDLEAAVDEEKRPTLHTIGDELAKLVHRCRVDDLWYGRKVLVPATEPLDLEQLVRSAVALQRTYAKHALDIEERYETDADGARVHLPAVLAEIVVDELLFNAINYVRLARLPRSTLLIGLESGSDSVTVFVENDARPSMVHRLTELWARLSAAGQRADLHEGEGTWGYGVGLEALHDLQTTLPEFAKGGETTGLGLHISDRTGSPDTPEHGRVRVAFTFPLAGTPS